jgi:hypothetical protein
MSVPRVRISPSPPALYSRALAIGVVILSVLLPGAAIAQNVSPQLAGLSFLIGNWQAGRGEVADSDVVPGHSVTFVSATRAGSPTFRLQYELANSTALAVKFEMAPPGSTTFRPIAAGTLTR